jgi:hypothetical protein
VIVSAIRVQKAAEGRRGRAVAVLAGVGAVDAGQLEQGGARPGRGQGEVGVEHGKGSPS